MLPYAVPLHISFSHPVNLSYSLDWLELAGSQNRGQSFVILERGAFPLLICSFSTCRQRSRHSSRYTCTSVRKCLYLGVMGSSGTDRNDQMNLGQLRTEPTDAEKSEEATKGAPASLSCSIGRGWEHSFIHARPSSFRLTSTFG